MRIRTGNALRLRRAKLAVVATTIAALAAPAFAEPVAARGGDPGRVQAYLAGPAATYFFDCDGYGAPSKSGDGMVTYAYQLGVFRGTGDQRRVTPTFGGHGVIACDAALAELKKHPSYWMRRASVLRGRAMHLLAMENLPAALADLDASEAEADKSDVYYQRSLGLGTDLVRAFALRSFNRQAEADALAAKVSAARPFSRQTAAAALVAGGPDMDFGVARPVLLRLAQLDPSSTGALYQETFERGRFAEALNLYDGLTPPVALGDEPMQFRQRALLEQDNRAAATSFWIDAVGRKAYALAALGRNDEARKALAEMHARQADATPPAPPLPPEPKPEQMARNAVHEQTNLKLKAMLPALVAQWDRLTEARLLLNEGKLDAASARIERDGAGPLPGTWASVDLTEKALTLMPPAGRPDLSAMRESLRKLRGQSGDYTLAALYAVLPEAEGPGRIPAYRTLGAGIVRVDGYKESPTDGGATKVRFYGPQATLASIEEAVLLRAADVARESGSNAMMLSARRDIERTNITTYYGTPSASDPAGFESQLDVRFLGTADADAAAWRRIDVSAVQSALAPVYRKERPNAGD